MNAQLELDRTPLWKPCLLLALLSLALFTPGITSLPPTDRDEARYVQASKQMLETGDYTRIFFQDAPRNKKPIATYWTQVGAVKLLSKDDIHALWAYRLPSLFAALLVPILLFLFGAPLVGRSGAFIGSFVIATIAMLQVESRLAKADATLLASIVLTQGCLSALYSSKDSKRTVTGSLLAFLMWASLAIGFLVKGPVAPMVFGLTVISLFLFERQGHRLELVRRLYPISGLLVFLVIATPWFFAVERASNTSFITQAWQEDILPKLISGHESHFGPPGYYLLTSLFTFWPWSLLTLPAVFWLWSKRQTVEGKFLLAWLIPSWLALECIPTKLPHYPLPLFPVLALAIGGLLTDSSFRKAWLPRKTFLWWKRTWMFITGVVLVFLIALPFLLKEAFPLPLVLNGVFICIGLFSVQKLRPEHSSTQFLVSFLPLVLVLPLTLGWVLPEFQAPWVSRTLANLEAVQKAAREGNLIVVGYREPSLVFLTDTKIALLEPQAAVERFVSKSESTLLTTTKDEDEIQSLLMNHFKSCASASIAVGFNYSKGKWIEFKKYERKGCITKES